MANKGEKTLKMRHSLESNLLRLTCATSLSYLYLALLHLLKFATAVLLPFASKVILQHWTCSGSYHFGTQKCLTYN